LVIFDGFKKPYLDMKGLYGCIFFLFVSFSLFGQSAGDFRSAASGNWNDVNTWERFDGLAWVNPAPSTPTSSDGIITIMDTHTVTVTSNVTADQIEWDNSCAFCGSSGSLVVTSGSILTINNGTGDDVRIINDFTDVGMLRVEGTLRLNTGATIVDDDYGNLGSGPGPVTSDTYKIANGGTHIHTTGAGVAPIPAADWQSGSTCQIDATTGTVPSITSGTIFHHFIWNGTSQGATLNLLGLLNNVNGDLTVTSTNSQVFQLSSTTSYTLNIGGNFSIQGSSRVQLTSTGTVTVSITGNLDIASTSGSVNAVQFNATGVVDVNVAGNFLKTNAATVNLCAGSTGTTTLDVTGDYSVTGGTVTRGATVTSGGATISFVGNNSKTYTNTTAGITTQINYAVGSNKTLNLGTSILSGTGSFSLGSNAVLGVGSTHASGALQSTNVTDADCGNLTTPPASRTFASGSRIIYNGTGAQVIGDGHPTVTTPSGGSIHTTINNSSGASLNGDRTIIGSLTLGPTAGSNLTIGPFTLTLNGAFTPNSNSLVISATEPYSNITIAGSGTFGTLTTSGGTTLNNLTLNRGSQTVTLGSDLTIAGTLDQQAGNLNYSNRTLTISNNYTLGSPGGNLTGNASSRLVVTGIGTVSTLPLNGTLGTLEINRESGAANTTSVTIADSLKLLGGVFGGSGAVILTDGITMVRGDGSTTKTFTVSTYDLIYENGAPIETGNELITTAVNNLTISGASSVTLHPSDVTELTVRGTLTLENGEFISNGKPVSLEGDFVSNGTGTFTNSLVTFSGNTTLIGSVNVELDDVGIEGGATLDLGSDVNLFVSGDFTPQSGAIMLPGTGMTTFFTGTTTLLIPDVATVP
jgi:hypothetical protein